MIEIVIDRNRLEGSLNLVGSNGNVFGVQEGTRVLESRPLPPDLRADPALPDDTRLWAALQNASGGPWKGSVYDVEQIVRLLEAGRRALDGRKGEDASRRPEEDLT